MAISSSTMIHAAPTSVRSTPSNGGCVSLSFDERGGFTEVTMFCGSAEMAIDLHAAISAVIDKHRQPAPAVELEAA